jgi:hypothetical protein
MNGVTQWEAQEIIREKNALIAAHSAEIERIKDRLGWICAVMDLDDDVTLQWIYTELQALRGVE